MIKKISLSNIRCFSKSEFEFLDGTNLIVGPNGSGKTSILEAIGLFGIGRLYSQNKDFRAVSFGCDVGRVEIKTEEKGKRHEASAAILEKSKIFKIDSNQVKVSKIIGFIKTVYFNPETIDLVSGSPRVRRGELDQVLGQVEPAFVTSLLKYRKVLKQRNGLLKRIALGLSQEKELDFWDDNMVELSLEIYSKRLKFVKAINERVRAAHECLTGEGGNLKIRYIPSCDYDRLSEVVLASRPTDIKINQTSVGPHRDDFEFCRLEGAALYKDQSSRGEQRLAAAAFKIASADFLKECSKTSPILIFDDIFSELDENHRQLIINVFNNSQVFVSATDEKVLPKNITERSNKIILTKNGRHSPIA